MASYLNFLLFFAFFPNAIPAPSTTTTTLPKIYYAQTFTEVDADSDGSISFAELLKTAKENWPIATVDQLDSYFFLYDIDHSKSIDPNEYNAMLGNIFRKEPSSNCIYLLFKKIDANGDKYISKSEYQNWLKLDAAAVNREWESWAKENPNLRYDKMSFADWVSGSGWKSCSL